jgi:hypothetical protein
VWVIVGIWSSPEVALLFIWSNPEGAIASQLLSSCVFTRCSTLNVSISENIFCQILGFSRTAWAEGSACRKPVPTQDGTTQEAGKAPLRAASGIRTCDLELERTRHVPLTAQPLFSSMLFWPCLQLHACCLWHYSYLADICFSSGILAICNSILICTVYYIWILVFYADCLL